MPTSIRFGLQPNQIKADHGVTNKVCERIMPTQLLRILVYPVTIPKVLPTEETLFPVEPLLIKELSTSYTN
jgi:hypothetical protein